MYKNKNVLGIIPARGGSKGIPRKNIVDLFGKPLISYTIDSAKKSKVITDLIVSTDDVEIAEVAKRYGANVPFIRPANLADDKSPMVPVVQHAVEFMEKEKGKKYDYIVLLQPTSPLKTTDDIDSTIQLLIDSGADNAYSMTKLTENTSHPLRIKKLTNGKVAPFFENEPEGTQRQGLTEVYRRNGAVFAFTRKLIMEEGSIFGLETSDTRAYIMPKERSVDVDSKEDLILAKWFIENGF